MGEVALDYTNDVAPANSLSCAHLLTNSQTRQQSHYQTYLLREKLAVHSASSPSRGARRRGVVATLPRFAVTISTASRDSWFCSDAPLPFVFSLGHAAFRIHDCLTNTVEKHTASA
jgi:hypothetical protein